MGHILFLKSFANVLVKFWVPHVTGLSVFNNSPILLQQYWLSETFWIKGEAPGLEYKGKQVKCI